MIVLIRTTELLLNYSYSSNEENQKKFLFLVTFLHLYFTNHLSIEKKSGEKTSTEVLAKDFDFAYKSPYRKFGVFR